MMVVSARKATGEWVYNPYPDTIIEKGMSMIVIATAEEKQVLMNFLAGEKDPYR